MKSIAIAAITLLFVSMLPTMHAQTRTVRKPGTTAPVSQSAPGRQTPNALLPLRRVILYSNGVAYFERRGNVTGRAEINLSFKQSQVDDVLKSMVVLDLGRGRIGAVSYNSSAPPDARLKEIPFSIGSGTDGDATGGIAGVLKQLQGAKVIVTTANGTVTGSIITVTQRRTNLAAQKNMMTVTHQLVLTTDSGELQTIDLDEARSVKLLDEGAKHDLTEFASATASARRRDAKTITVTSDGEGQREMMISYTIAAPIWKTNYRVVLDAAGHPYFQGWAIVDNVSEEDWTDVQLSLVSGSPVSFIQPTQQPLYRYRPIVPIPQDLKLSPQTYESGWMPDGRAAVDGTDRRNAPSQVTIPGLGQLGGFMLDPSAAARAGLLGAQPLNQQAQNLPLNNRNFLDLSPVMPGVAAPAPSLSAAITSGDSGVEAAAAGSEVGELFEYRIEQPVTVRRDRSALIPILQTQLEGERVSIYNETARRDRPMNGIRLKNTSPLTLEGGALTMIDADAYAGEALMARLKPQEQSYISFGLDLGTLISAKTTGERRPVFMVRAGKGVFEAHYHQTQKKLYTIINQTDKKRIVYLEHPISDGWTLSADTQKPASRTANWYRFRIELAPRANVELPVVETTSLKDSYQISNLTQREIELFVSGNYLDATTRAQLDRLLELKTRITGVEARIEKLDEEEEAISEDQKRLRENIEALKNTAEAKQLIARYIAKADQQETRIEQIPTEKQSAQTEVTRLQTELDAAIQAFTLERRL
jgi:hypothetical protein